MKSTYLLMAMAVVGMMTSCSKDKETLSDSGNDSIENLVPEDNGPVAVRLGASSANVSLETKAVGSVNAWNGFQDLYVYGLEKGAVDYTAATYLMENVKASSPKEPATDSLLSVKHWVDEKGEEVAPNTGNAKEESYFYGQTAVYEFYGYHIDDAGTGEKGVGVPAKTAGSVAVPFKINGSQDLMIAKADPEKDLTNAVEGVLSKPSNTDRVYSAYAARRGVHPTLVFEHVLSQFVFQAYAGSDSGKSIFVDSVIVKNVKCEGDLVFIGTTTGIQNLKETVVDMRLMERTTSDKTQRDTMVVLKSVKLDQATKDSPLTIGESMMVMPDVASYDLEVYMHQEGNNSKVPPFKVTLKAEDVKKAAESAGISNFQKGESYTIKLAIYGLEEVKIFASLTKWKEGGQIEIDPDEVAQQ